MTALLLAIAVYILGMELDSRWLLWAGCALQVWGMIQLRTQIVQLKARRERVHARKHARKRKKSPSHKVIS